MNWSLQALRPSHEAFAYAWSSHERLDVSTTGAAAQLGPVDLNAVANADVGSEWRTIFEKQKLVLVAPPEYLGDRASSYGAGVRLRLTIDTNELQLNFHELILQASRHNIYYYYTSSTRFYLATCSCFVCSYEHRDTT